MGTDRPPRGATTPSSVSVEVEPRTVGVLVDARPTAGCGLGSVGHPELGPGADQLEIAGEGECVGRVDRGDQELLRAVRVVRRAGVEVLVARRRLEGVRGVEEATESLAGRRLPAAERAEVPQV